VAGFEVTGDTTVDFFAVAMPSLLGSALVEVTLLLSLDK
jgi:hypothetical protein